MILAALIDVMEKIAIPLGLALGALVAWRMGAFRAGHQAGLEWQERRRKRREERKKRRDGDEPDSSDTD